MAIDFPAGPTEGQRFISGGTLFTFSQGVWGGAPLGTALPFNFLVNPSFQCHNEGGGAKDVAKYYFADQWIHWGSPLGNIQGERLASRTINGSQYRHRAYVYTAKAVIAAGDWVQSPYHFADGFRMLPFQWGTAGGLPGVLRFWLTAPQGTYAVAIRNSVTDRSFVMPIVVTPARHNLPTEYVFPIAPDLTGVWYRDNRMALQLSWSWMCGSTYVTPTPNTWIAGNFLAATGVSNGFATAGNSFEVQDPGLYLDPYGTGKAPRFEVLDEGVAWADSLRYWQKNNSMRGISAGANSDRSCNQHSVFMRTGPALAKVGAVYAWDQATAQSLTGALVAYVNNYYTELSSPTAAAMTHGRPCFHPQDNNPELYIASSARF